MVHVFHLGVNVFLFILSEIWLANFGKTLTYNNNDSILFQKPRVSWVVALICPMPGCSLLKLLVLGICVLRLLQPAPCKMILLCCMSLGELPTTSLFVIAVRGEDRKHRCLLWPGTVPLAPRPMGQSPSQERLASRGGEVKSTSWKGICKVTLECTWRWGRKGWKMPLQHTRMSTCWKCPQFCLWNMFVFNDCFCDSSKIGNLNHNSARSSDFHLYFVNQYFFSLSAPFSFPSWSLLSLSVLSVGEYLLFVCNKVLKPGLLIGWRAKIGEPHVFS